MEPGSAIGVKRGMRLALLLTVVACPALLLAAPDSRTDHLQQPPAYRVPAFAPGSKTAPTERAAAAKSINRFGAKAYAVLRARPGNLAFSPASAALALGMASAGARGETLSQMQAALSHTLLPSRQHARSPSWVSDGRRALAKGCGYRRRTASLARPPSHLTKNSSMGLPATTDYRSNGLT
jgi:hypothetical protein